MRFCSGLPVRAVRIASPLCPASDKTQDILFSVLSTEPVPWAPIQHSASSSPVRTTFGQFPQVKGLLCKIFCDFLLFSEVLVPGSFATFFSWIFTTLFSQGLLTGDRPKEWSLNTAWFLSKELWRISLYSLSHFAALKMLNHKMLFYLWALL